MDGVTATKEIRKSYEKTPPIIVLSANAMEGDKETYLANGFDGYVAKPVTFDKLKTSLARILS
ncbi:response regulator [Flavobacteriales bacterium]|jgi:CheY-like chemotaxis protein|nr:response regulator [Flavobacteriales bacterium]